MALKRGTGGSIEGGLAGESSDINAKFEMRVQQIEYNYTQLKDIRVPKIVVGNATAGDTLADCDYLDTGDGAQLQAALTFVGTLGIGGQVAVRGGVWNLTGPLSIPTFCKLTGTGIGTVFRPAALDRRAFILANYATLQSIAVELDTPGVGATGATVIQTAYYSVVDSVALYQIYTANLTNMTNESIRYAINCPANGAGCIFSNLDITLPSFASVSLAQSMTGIAFFNGTSDNSSCIVSNCRIVGGDIGIDATGNAICDTVSIGACQRRGMILAAQTFDSLFQIVSSVRIRMGSSTSDYAGIEVVTGTLASGVRNTKIVGCSVRASPSPNATSTGIRLSGTGEGVNVSASSIDGFPLGVTVSATQTLAKFDVMIRGATTNYTDASGSANFGGRTENIGPFSATLAAGQTNTTTVFGSAGMGWVAPRAGSITALTAMISAAVTTANATVVVEKALAASPTAFSQIAATLVTFTAATNTTARIALVRDAATLTFAVGDVIRVSYSSGAIGNTPTLAATVEVTM